MASQSRVNFTAFFSTFISGFIAVSTAMIMFDQTLYYEGSNSFAVTGLLSAAFLGFAAGCLLSGLFKSFFRRKSKTILILAAAWLGVFFSTLVVSLLWYYLADTWALAVFLVFGPFIFFLLWGIIFSYGISTFRDRTGVLSALTSLGFFTGAIVTDLVLLNLLGISWSVFLNCCLLLLCAVLSLESFSGEVITGSLIIAVAVIMFGLNIRINHNDPYHAKFNTMNSQGFLPAASLNYPVATDFTSHSKSSDKNQYPYIPLLKQIIYHNLNLKNQNVLVLGQGGYQLMDDDKSNTRFTYLNYGTGARPSACTYLDLISRGNHLFLKDENAIWKPGQHYDLIVSNVFPNDRGIPPELLSYQHMLKIRNALPEKGIAIFNVIANPTLSDLKSKRVDNTIRSVFPSCMEIPLKYTSQPTNIIYICQKSNEEKDNIVYTGNYSAAVLNTFAAFLEGSHHGFV